MTKAKLKELYLETNKALQAIEAASYFVDGGIGDWENANHKELVKFVTCAQKTFLIY